MAKQTGLGDQLLVDGFDLSGDIQQLGRVAGGNTPLDMTGINKSAYERQGGLRDGGIDFTAFFNKDTSAEHPTLKTLPTGDRIVTYGRGSVAGSQAASIVAKQVNYDPARGADGSLTLGVSAVANGFGLDWGRSFGVMLHFAAGNEAGVDNGASTAFGLQAYLHVLSFSGTSITVKIQESSDNGGGDPYADVAGGSFAAASAVGAQRIQTARALTVERWLRISTTGTFSLAAFMVQVTRNDTTVVY
jgi:hypothetical protein